MLPMTASNHEIVSLATRSACYITIDSEGCMLFLIVALLLGTLLPQGMSYVSGRWVGGRYYGWEYYYSVMILFPGFHIFSLDLIGVTLTSPANFMAINYDWLTLAALLFIWPNVTVSAVRAARRRPGAALVYTL